MREFNDLDGWPNNFLSIYSISKRWILLISPSSDFILFLLLMRVQRPCESIPAIDFRHPSWYWFPVSWIPEEEQIINLVSFVFSMCCIYCLTFSAPFPPFLFYSFHRTCRSPAFVHGLRPLVWRKCAHLIWWMTPAALQRAPMWQLDI